MCTNRDVVETRKHVVRPPATPPEIEIIEENQIIEKDPPVVSDFVRVRLPNGRMVEAAIQKISDGVAELTVKDELGLRVFIVEPTQDGTGIHVPEKMCREYEQDGEKHFEEIVSCEGEANKLVAAIARKLMAIRGISFEQALLPPIVAGERGEEDP